MRRHVYYYTHIVPPHEVAAERLLGNPAMWLPPPAEPGGEGWRVLLYAEGVLPAGFATRLASVCVGEATVSHQRLLLPLTW